MAIYGFYKPKYHAREKNRQNAMQYRSEAGIQNSREVLRTKSPKTNLSAGADKIQITISNPKQNATINYKR